MHWVGCSRNPTASRWCAPDRNKLQARNPMNSATIGLILGRAQNKFQAPAKLRHLVAKIGLASTALVDGDNGEYRTIFWSHHVWNDSRPMFMRIRSPRAAWSTGGTRQLPLPVLSRLLRYANAFSNSLDCRVSHP
jgi:hypothetical protein